MEIRSFRYSARQAAPRRKLLGRFLSFALGLILLSSVGGYGYLAINKPLPLLSITLNPSTPVPGEAIVLPWPSSGNAAVGSLKEGVLSQSATTELPRPMASTAKIITALAIMKQKPFIDATQGATITLDATDVVYYNNFIAMNGSVTKVSSGEQLTQYQALQALLIPSSNNMADSLARWAFGSPAAYVTYANAMLKEMGLSKTVIADASGFSAGSISTPSELVLLGRKLLSDPILKQIVSQKEAVIPVAGTISSTNQLLPGSAIGIKTGHTDEAGWCLVFARETTEESDKKSTVIGAVLGAFSSAALYSAADNLLTTSSTSFSEREVVKKDQTLGTYSSAWKQQGSIVPSESLSVYGWKGSLLTPEVTSSLGGTTVSAGQEAGTVRVNDTSLRLNADKEIAPPSLWWRLTHYFDS